MKTRMILTLLAVTLLTATTAYPDDVSELRARGQLGVDELHARWAAAAPADRVQLQKTLDQVCAQQDCHAARLFWYTYLADAEAAARRLGRPILSLHLLGRLDEELSCANSRFFRTLLYSDDAISTILRDKYVLHWYSVREVPHVTIELGGGRVIRQTITGNSAHFLLAADGTPLDVLPGLYSPAAFREQLERWATMYESLPAGDDRAEALRGYHQWEYLQTSRRAEELGIDRAAYEGVEPVWVAQLQSQSKAATEVKPLRQMLTAAPDRTQLRARILTILGEQGKRDVAFSPGTLALMSSKQKLTTELLDNLRRTVAVDTATNEYDLHRRIHEWFGSGEVSDLHALNERVYDELFLTPSSDPWLGLLPDDVFTGIDQSELLGQPPAAQPVLSLPASAPAG
jgi:hypothetical protein